MKPLRKFQIVDEPPVVVAMSRAMVIRGRVVWPWRKLSKAHRQNVDDNSRPEFLDAEHLDAVLEARTLGSHATRRTR